MTGADVPTWPDVRTPRPAGRRQRWPWLLLAVTLVGGGLWFVLSHQHHRVELADGLSCNSNRIRSMAIDYTWTSGPDSPSAALDSFLRSVHAKGLPTSGYARPNALPATPNMGDVAPSVKTAGFDYVHATRGHVDVGLHLEKSGGIWEVSEVEACT